MHKLEELKDKLMGELEDYAGNAKFSKEDVEAIKYTASAIDHICNIMDKEDGYSGTYYGRGRSYARGRGRNARRDAMGRYSTAAEDMVAELRELMEDAPNERTRKEFERFIRDVEAMS